MLFGAFGTIPNGGWSSPLRSWFRMSFRGGQWLDKDLGVNYCKDLFQA